MIKKKEQEVFKVRMMSAAPNEQKLDFTTELRKLISLKQKLPLQFIT